MNSLAFNFKKLFQCQSSLVDISRQGRASTGEFPTTSGIDVSIFNQMKIPAHMCACAEMKSGGCSRLKLARDRLSKTITRHDLQMIGSASKIESDMRNSHSECGAVDHVNRQVLLTSHGDNYIDWRNQQSYAVIIHSAPSINKTKYSANYGNRQGNSLKYRYFLHVISNQKNEKDSTI